MDRRYTQAGAKLAALLAVVTCFVACSLFSHPEQKILGKWQSKPMRYQLYNREQFEFLGDGTVAASGRVESGHHGEGRWDQFATGTFRFSDSTHLRIDLGWIYGANVYEVEWVDNDHLRLRAGDETIELDRLR